MLPINADEILKIHDELKKQVAALKSLHVKFAATVAETDIDELVEELASQIEEVEGCVEDLEAEVLP